MAMSMVTCVGWRTDESEAGGGAGLVLEFGAEGLRDCAGVLVDGRGTICTARGCKCGVSLASQRKKFMDVPAHLSTSIAAWFAPSLRSSEAPSR